jgi:hypothetical protein
MKLFFYTLTMPHGEDHITKKELDVALKRTTDDICDTLNGRIDGVDRTLDAFHLEMRARFDHIDKTLDQVLTAALDYHALAERLTRIENHLHLRKPTNTR